jgi:hypothetical protein
MLGGFESIGVSFGTFSYLHCQTEDLGNFAMYKALYVFSLMGFQIDFQIDSSYISCIVYRLIRNRD